MGLGWRAKNRERIFYERGASKAEKRGKRGYFEVKLTTEKLVRGVGQAGRDNQSLVDGQERDR